MKTRNIGPAFLCVIFILLFFQNSYAQNKFVQPGAVWSYCFKFNLATNSYPIQIIYKSDTIINGDTCHKLATQYIYKLEEDCLTNQWSYLKQKGDTVFFNNQMTNGTWQILYNFATPVGQAWVTSIKAPGFPIQNLIVVVDSASSVVVNGVTLKRRNLRFLGGVWGTERVNVTERLGCHQYMFNYYRQSCNSDYNLFDQYLCYKDNELGTYKMNTLPCNCQPITNLAETKKNVEFKVFPNPATEKIKIITYPLNGTQKEVYFYNVLGELIKNVVLDSEDTDISILELPKGIYSVIITDKNSAASVIKLSVE